VIGVNPDTPCARTMARSPAGSVPITVNGAVCPLEKVTVLVIPPMLVESTEVGWASGSSPAARATT
jgi:hypothetical protein